MHGKIEVTGIKQRRLTGQAFEHRRLQIVDHELRGHTMEGLEGMLMTAEEMLHGLRDGEFQIHQTAVAEHHDEEAELAPRRTDLDRAIFAPIDLGSLPR